MDTIVVKSAKDWVILVVLGWDPRGLSQDFEDDALKPLGHSLDSI